MWYKVDQSHVSKTYVVNVSVDMRLVLQPCQGYMHVLRDLHVWQVTPVGHSVCARHGSG